MTRIFSVVSVKTGRTWLLSVLVLCLLISTLQARSGLSKRWIYVSSNLYVNENIQKLERLLRRTQKAGYNGILFTDYKTFTWWQLDNAQRWRRNARKLRDITRELEMELVMCVFPFGYAGSLLWHDVNESLMSATSSLEAQRLHEQGKAVIYRPLKKPSMTQQQAAARQAEHERQRQEAAKRAEQERQRQQKRQKNKR